MKIEKDLTNAEVFDPLDTLELDNGKFIDLHNDFVFTGIAFNRMTNRLTVNFEGKNEKENLFISFLNITELEISFLNDEGFKDPKILLDNFCRSEDRKILFPENKYFFIDFTNGMHIDVNCERCLLEYVVN